MTDTAQEKPVELRRKTDFKFWTIAGLVSAVLGFNVAERLLLDADEADISYARLVIPANLVTNPSPGDVFVFNHDSNLFVESRFCALQIFGEAEPVTDTIKASNIWGVSVNATIIAVSDYFGKKITDFARVENAEREWHVKKIPRQNVRAPLQEECLAPVLEAVENPKLTPFVVDAVYTVEDHDGQKEWVRFANPIMLDPASCQGGCPELRTLRDIVQANALTQFKLRYGIVHVQ